MSVPPREGRAIRIASAGHALFAAVLIWLGAMGLSKGDFVQVWQPVPNWVPAREVLAYLCALISLASGIGLLWQRTAGVAARVIFASLMVWLLALRLPNLFFQTPVVLVDSLSLQTIGAVRPASIQRLGGQFNFSVLRVRS